MKTLAVVLVTYNREDFVGRCIASIARAASDALQVRIIAMDNGSTDGTPAALEAARAALPPGATLEVFRTEDNRPVPGVLNRGHEEAYRQHSDYVIMMNDDTEFEGDSLLRLIAACDAYPDSLLVPLQMNYREQDHIDATMLNHIRRMDALLEDGVLERGLKQVYPQTALGAAAMLGRTALWREIGEWDETFLFYGIDDDFCKRARYLGYATYLVPGSRIFHAHGKLGARPAEQTKAGLDAKWRKETQARFWFILKEPGAPFEQRLRELRQHAYANAFACLRGGWLYGARESIALYRGLVRQKDALREKRARHFPGADSPEGPSAR
jgi:GT2 family glycosyltransferase